MTPRTVAEGVCNICIVIKANLPEGSFQMRALKVKAQGDAADFQNKRVFPKKQDFDLNLLGSDGKLNINNIAAFS